jgi:hypothetical protein
MEVMLEISVLEVPGLNGGQDTSHSNGGSSRFFLDPSDKCQDSTLIRPSDDTDGVIK